MTKGLGMKWQDMLALGRPTLEEGGCIVSSLCPRTCFRKVPGGGCISSARGLELQSGIGLCTRAQGFFLLSGLFFLAGRYPNTLTQSFGRAEDCIHRQKKAGVRGKMQ